jgi:TRAP-type uncharacterized transport system substrate-binding protein
MNNTQHFILLIFIILLLFYSFNNYLSTQEHYLTYFFPFYDNEKNTLYQFYKDEEYKHLNTKKHFMYEPIRIGYLQYEQNQTTNYLSTLLLARSKIQKIQRIPFQNIEDLVQSLKSNQIQFALLSIPTIANLTFQNKNTTQDFTSLNYVLSFFRRYLFIFTKEKYGISNLRNIPLATKIGIVHSSTSTSKPFGKDIMDFLQYKINRDYQFIFYPNAQQLIKGFQNDEIQIMFYQGYFPDEKLTQLLNQSILDKVYLLPFQIPREDVFYQSHFQYYPTTIDLNHLSPSYLPKKFDNQEWNRYKPTLKILGYDEYLMTNKMVSNDIIYETIKTYYESIDFLNTLPEIQNNPISKVGIEKDTNMPVLYHNGAYKFYKEKGFITDNPNPNCKYLVGVMECNEQNLEDNNLLYNGPQL